MHEEKNNNGCCYNEETKKYYEFETISPTLKQCLGCYEKTDDDDDDDDDDYSYKGVKK